MEILLLPLTPLLIFPYAAAVPALLLGVFGWRRKSRFSLFAAIIWFLYGLYETLIYHRILCSGECNIRVDLLLIYPFLIVITIISIVLLVRAARNKPDQSLPRR